MRPLPKSFQARLFMALALVLLAMLLLFSGLSRLALHQGLGQYVAEIEIDRLQWLENSLLQRYAQDESWAFLRDDGAWRDLVRQPEMQRSRFNPPMPRPASDGPDGAVERGLAPPAPPPPPQGQAFSPRPPPPGPPPVSDIERRLALLDPNGTRLAGADLAPDQAVRRPVLYQGETVAQLALAQAQPLQSDADRTFARRQLLFLLATGTLALLAALLVSWLLGRRWLRPVAWLTDGARKMAAGQFDARVPVRGDDELAALGHAFNRMAQELEHIETTRQHWLSDVAHELRTPLAGMRAEIEALQDGVHRFDAGAAERLLRQVLRLSRLVDDLRLTLGQDVLPARLEPLDPVQLLLDVAQDMQARYQQAGLRLDEHALHAFAQAHRDPYAVRVRGDAQRLQQVFQNLLENSLRYTDAGGEVVLSADLDARRRWLVLQVDDSAPGVAPERLERLFDRFYSGDASRSRQHGGSGLGLAIGKAIVEALGGRITAAASSRQGLQVRIELPLAQTDTHPSQEQGNPA